MNDMPVPDKFGVGQPVRRFEDVRLLTGAGQYLDDVNLPGQAYGYLLRSPVAHAAIKSIDTAAAKASPGVVAILTGDDLEALGVNNIPCGAPVENRDGSERGRPKRPILAVGRVRHVGEAVAYVVAETLADAKSAAELIEVDYDMLDANSDPATATEPGKPQLHDDVPNNLVLDWGTGDDEAVAKAFDGAAHVTRVNLINNRVTAHPMEGRGAIAEFDADGKLTLYSSTQGGWSLRGNIAENFLKSEPDDIRIVTPDVGGGFGMKIFIYPEYLATIFAAREAGRAVKWIADRAESFLADNAGRDHVTEAELALDAEHRIQALRIKTTANMGAYLSGFAPFIPTLAATNVLGGVYDVKNVSYLVKAVMTNTCPVDAYRGAGRPESNYVMERLLDAAARELGIEPGEIRRLNMIPPDELPTVTAAGNPYDSGEFVRVMDSAIANADWKGAAKRKADSAKLGLKRGIGLAYYIEATVGFAENVRVTFADDGTVSVAVGTQTNGQGHETGYRQLLHARLGIPIENIRVTQGDTASLPMGGGTGGSRSLLAAGTAIHAASDDIIDKGKRLAADELETAVADIEFGDGEFRVAGTDRAIALLDLAAKAAARSDLPEDLADGLDTYAETNAEHKTYPNGCHIAEVVIDPATGHVTLDRYTVVDDIGVLVNPMIVRGQVHGGVAQGLGQALHEQHAYDESGQLITGSLLDYDLPKADDLPSYSSDFIEVPCATNIMGIKGAGEAGAVGAPAAAINAIVDALAEDGVTHIDMPATPEKVWRALNG